jgi:hypothetical protein
MFHLTESIRYQYIFESIFITLSFTYAKTQYPINGRGLNQISNEYESEKKCYLLLS